MALLAELGRSKVRRTAAAYLICALVVMQVVEWIINASGLPQGAGAVALIMLIAGFPSALIVAWAFELPPQGPKPKKAAKKAQKHAEPIKPFGATDGTLLAVLAVIIAVLAWQQLAPGTALQTAADRQGAAVEDGAQGEATEDMAATGPVSIAVLAFDDLSPDGDEEYFSDGFSEALLNALVQVDGLRVASRVRAFDFKGTESGVPEITAQLNVRYVVQGSVRRENESIHVMARLIDSEAEQPGAEADQPAAEPNPYLWSETFERTLTAADIFAIRDEIASAIVIAIGVEQEAAPSEANLATGNLGAYDAYLRARESFLVQRDLGQAETYLTQAVELDPDFADAWELRGLMHYLAVGTRQSDDENRYARALEYSARAISLDAESSVAVGVLAIVDGGAMSEMDAATIARGIEGFSRAIEIDPHNAVALNWRGGLLNFVGHLEAASEDFTRCIEIEPAYSGCYYNLAFNLAATGNDEAAFSVFINAVDQSVLDPRNPFMFGLLARLGKRDMFILSTSAMYGPNAPWGDYEVLYEMFRNPLGDYDHLMQAIIEFEGERDEIVAPYGGIDILIGNYDRFVGFYGVPWMPEMTGYLASDNFQANLQAGPLPEFWRAHGFPPRCGEGEEGRIECF